MSTRQIRLDDEKTNTWMYGDDLERAELIAVIHIVVRMAMRDEEIQKVEILSGRQDGVVLDTYARWQVGK